MGEMMKLTRDRIEEIAREVYRCDRFTPTDEVWCNLHWLTLFAEAVERETLTEKDREIERLKAHTCEVGAENLEVMLGELKNLTPEETQELHRLFQPRASYRELADQLSTSQAREREALERAEETEASKKDFMSALAATRKALGDVKPYLRHLGNCAENRWPASNCTCGLSAALNGDSHE